MDLTSKYLRRFKNIKLNKTDLQIDSRNYSESDSDDEEIEESRNDLFVIDKTPINLQINRIPELLPESNINSENMTKRKELAMDLNFSSENDLEAYQSSDDEESKDSSVVDNSPLPVANVPEPLVDLPTNISSEKDPESNQSSDEDEESDSLVIDNSAVNMEEVPEPLTDLPEFKVMSETTKTKRFDFPSRMNPGIDESDTYLNVNPDKEPKEATSRLMQLSLKLVEKQKLLDKSVLKPGYEQQYTVPSYLESLRQKKKARKVEHEKTKGDKWFNMPAPEMTDELKNDLKVLKMRKALDPKHFYKKNDRSVPPKYFQIGTVVEGAADFYHARVPKKDRKRTMVDELLADAEFRKFSKRKYAEVLASRPQRKGAQKHMRRLKKKKK